MNRGIQLDALSVPIELGLRIVLSIERNNEVIKSVEISKHGVLMSVQDQILESKTLVPRPLVTDKISISKIKGSKLYALTIDLPAGLASTVGTDKLITLTTCTPRYGTTGRWIWWGHLVEELPKEEPPSDVK